MRRRQDANESALGGRSCYRRRRTEGKRPLEAIRCLKRRISDSIYRQLVTAAATVGLPAFDPVCNSVA